jgi:ribosomal protein S18 acetylase RimI-like enzyme
MALTIRTIGRSELHLVTELSAQIWPIAYKEIITREQIKYMLNTMYSQQALEQNLSDGHSFLVAERDGNPVGYAGYQVHFPSLEFSKLHKLYVLPETQQTGVGSALFNEVVSGSKNEHCKHLILQVNKINPALQFYHKKGMYIHEEAVFDIGNCFVMDDYIMRIDW